LGVATASIAVPPQASAAAVGEASRSQASPKNNGAHLQRPSVSSHVPPFVQDGAHAPAAQAGARKGALQVQTPVVASQEPRPLQSPGQ